MSDYDEYKPYYYSEYNDFNRYQNLDQIEGLIVNHLVNSTTKHANNLWKILRYNDMYALSKPNLTVEERLALISNDNGDQTSKRVFFAPFTDDAWTEQCSSIYVYVERIFPRSHLESVVYVTVETVVHSKISAIAGDGDPENNSSANPNDSDKKGDIVVSFKNRATVLLKSILAELNGLYINGVGYLQMNNIEDMHGQVKMPLFNNRSFYGHASSFVVLMANVSGPLDETEPYNSL